MEGGAGFAEGEITLGCKDEDEQTGEEGDIAVDRRMPMKTTTTATEMVAINSRASEERKATLSVSTVRRR